MNLAAGTYSAFLPLKMPIAAKTGTAQERTTDPDHATLISYAPYDNPQYVWQCVFRMVMLQVML